MAIDESAEDKKPLLDEVESFTTPSQTTTAAVSTEQVTAQLQSERKFIFSFFQGLFICHSYLFSHNDYI